MPSNVARYELILVSYLGGILDKTMVILEMVFFVIRCLIVLIALPAVMGSSFSIETIQHFLQYFGGKNGSNGESGSMEVRTEMTNVLSVSNLMPR